MTNKQCAGVWVKADSAEAQDEQICIGDKIKIYSDEKTVTGFYGSYNEALHKWETIILTEGRGDPFERSIDVIEIFIDEENPKSIIRAFPDKKASIAELQKIMLTFTRCGYSQATLELLNFANDNRIEISDKLTDKLTEMLDSNNKKELNYDILQELAKDEQPIPVNQDSYWKKRCEAAEKIMAFNNVYANAEEWATWENLVKQQQLKSSPSPTPVQEGLREDAATPDLELFLEWVILNYSPIVSKENEVLWNDDDSGALYTTEEVIKDFKVYN